jgi:hypothetical protein
MNGTTGNQWLEPIHTPRGKVMQIGVISTTVSDSPYG